MIIIDIGRAGIIRARDPNVCDAPLIAFDRDLSSARFIGPGPRCASFIQMVMANGLARATEREQLCGT
jgi:hypothetical protein